MGITTGGGVGFDLGENVRTLAQTMLQQQALRVEQQKATQARVKLKLDTLTELIGDDPAERENYLATKAGQKFLAGLGTDFQRMSGKILTVDQTRQALDMYWNQANEDPSIAARRNREEKSTYGTEAAAKDLEAANKKKGGGTSETPVAPKPPVAPVTPEAKVSTGTGDTGGNEKLSTQESALSVGGVDSQVSSDALIDMLGRINPVAYEGASEYTGSPKVSYQTLDFALRNPRVIAALDSGELEGLSQFETDLVSAYKTVQAVSDAKGGGPSEEIRRWSNNPTTNPPASSPSSVENRLRKDLGGTTAPVLRDPVEPPIIKIGSSLLREPEPNPLAQISQNARYTAGGARSAPLPQITPIVAPETPQVAAPAPVVAPITTAEAEAKAAEQAKTQAKRDYRVAAVAQKKAQIQTKLEPLVTKLRAKLEKIKTNFQENSVFTYKERSEVARTNAEAASWYKKFEELDPEEKVRIRNEGRAAVNQMTLLEAHAAGGKNLSDVAYQQQYLDYVGFQAQLSAMSKSGEAGIKEVGELVTGYMKQWSDIYAQASKDAALQKVSVEEYLAKVAPKIQENLNSLNESIKFWSTKMGSKIDLSISAGKINSGLLSAIFPQWGDFTAEAAAAEAGPKNLDQIDKDFGQHLLP